MTEQIYSVAEKEALVGDPPAENKPAPSRRPERRKRTITILRRVLLGVAAFGILNLVVLLLEPYFLYVSGFQSAIHNASKITLYQQQPRQDILFMGSSRVEWGLDPQAAAQAIAEKTGVVPRILNLGTPVAGIDYSYLLLKNIVQDDKKPSVIVYGLAEAELGDPPADNNYFQSLTSGVPYSQVVFRPDDLALFGGDKPEQKAAFLLNQLVPLVRDQQLIVQGLDIQFNLQNEYHSNFVKNKYLPPDGFTALGLPIPPDEQEKAAAFYKESLPKLTVDKTKLNFLQKFVDLAHSRGIKVVLVNMPVTAKHIGFWQNAAHVKEYLATVRQFATANNVPYMDWYENNEQYLDPASFYDLNHLDQHGAEIISRYLGQNYLAEDFTAADASSPEFYRARLSDLNLRPRLPSATLTTGTVSLVNLSPGYWPISGNRNVRLSYHWLHPDGSMAEFEGVRTDFEYSPKPGDSQDLTFKLLTPDTPGNYILELDLIQENVSWFATKGAATLRQSLIIER